MITERGYVATRQGLECFEKQLYAEALQRGLSQAESKNVTYVYHWTILPDIKPLMQEEMFAWLKGVL